MSAFTREQLCAVMNIPFSHRQLEAITAPMEPYVIMAGAGSGKTAVMTARVVWLVATAQVEPSQVLGLTFTNKAAAEFRGRVRKALMDLEVPVDWADATTVATYHSFAQQLLVDDGIRIGLEPDLQLLSDVRREQLAMQVVRKPKTIIRELSHSTKSVVQQALDLDNRLAEEAVDPADLRAFDEALLRRMAGLPQQRVGDDIIATSRKRLELIGLVEQFREAKLQRQSIDYADMIRHALRLVLEREEVVGRLRDTYRVVLLDEYQDTSVAQRLLMQHAFGNAHPVTAVGDALQAIYEWRGANAINIIDFKDHFPRRSQRGELTQSPILGLPTTQRFGSRIAALANDITETLRPALEGVEALEAQSDDTYGPGVIDVALHADQASEFAWVAEQLRAAHEETPWGGMAVLLREHRYSADMYEALTTAGIPAQIVGKQGLLGIPDIADVVAYLRVIHDPAANPSWVRILSGMRYRIGTRDLAHLGHRAAELASVHRSDGDWQQALAQSSFGTDAVDVVALGDAIGDLGDGSSVSAEARERIAALDREIRALRRHAGVPVADLIRIVVRRIGLDVEIAASTRAQQRGRAATLDAFMDLVSQFSSLESSRSLSAFLQWLQDGEHMGKQAQLEHPMERDAVAIMTVHAAKGLQRDVVALPVLVEGTFPSTRSDGSWPKSADALPFALLHTPVAEDLLEFPTDQPRDKEWKAFSESLRPRNLAEETRLAYVAVTRARRKLIASGARSYRGRRVKPSPYLESAKAAAERGHGEVHFWAEDAPEAALSTVQTAPWPQQMDPAHVERLRALAEAVAKPQAVLESDRASAWDAAIAQHRQERIEQRRTEHMVPMPVALTATQIQSVLDDPDAFASTLVRPMPKQPAIAAKRGSAFHAWVERQYGQQLLIISEFDDADDDAALEPLKEAFMRTPWSARTPLALELPFSIGIGSQCVRGRIDAVYRDGDGIAVVDWKTSGSKTADPVQLSIYRRAAAAHFGLDLDQVRACFVYVALGETVWLEGEDDLDERLSGVVLPMLDDASSD